MIGGFPHVKSKGSDQIVTRGNFSMHRIRHPSRRSSNWSLWLGLLAAITVIAGFVHYSSIQAEKKKTGNYNYLKTVPSNSVLKSKLTEDQYRVTRQNGTETAFRNEYWDNNRPGIYVDVITNDPLFSSLDKIDAGTGRPTFTKPISPDSVFEQPDNSNGMNRIEARAKLSNSHLGHVFKEPASPTGERYAVNSAALRFVPQEKMESEGYAEYLHLFEKKE
jgi:peptide-methionine (R)-S-oxide reductase